MGMRSPLDPYGGRAGLVDKFIGDAFDIVHAVSRHLSEIKYLVMNMEAIIIVAKNLPDTSTKTVGARLGFRGETVSVPMPEGITMANIVSSTVLALDGQGNAYQTNNGDFYFHIQNGALKLTLSSAAPATMSGAEVRWNIVYRIR